MHAAWRLSTYHQSIWQWSNREPFARIICGSFGDVEHTSEPIHIWFWDDGYERSDGKGVEEDTEILASKTWLTS